MVRSKKLCKTKNGEILKIGKTITIRTGDPEVKTVIRNVADYLQTDNVSEVVRRALFEFFKAVKVREEKQAELNKIAEIYDLKVVPKFKRD